MMQNPDVAGFDLTLTLLDLGKAGNRHRYIAGGEYAAGCLAGVSDTGVMEKVIFSPCGRVIILARAACRYFRPEIDGTGEGC